MNTARAFVFSPSPLTGVGRGVGETAISENVARYPTP